MVDTSLLRTVPPLPAEELKNLHTGSLLSRLSELQGLQDAFELSDWSEEERSAVAHLICFKNTSVWETAMAELKAELSTREHFEKGSKRRRQEDARRRKHR